MRRYADPVEVRRGVLETAGAGRLAHGATEGPQQFLWRGRLWKVRAVLAHSVETGAWWQSGRVDAVIGSEDAEAETTDRGPTPLGELLTERELWRVEAGRPRPPARTPDGDTERGITGVFDLSFDWADGCWTLVGCAD
jgi:hypothetical protein